MMDLLFHLLEFEHPRSGTLRFRPSLRDYRGDEQRLRWSAALISAAWRAVHRREPFWRRAARAWDTQ